MKTAVFSTQPYDQQFLCAANLDYGHELAFFEARLTRQTTPLAHGYPAVCLFVNDHGDAEVLADLQAHGTRLIALRSAGFNHIDLNAAERLGLTVVRVPAYSPHAVAEHAVALILGLNRKIHRAYARVREGNFSLDGLLGFDLYKRTVGIIGTGKIGLFTAKILAGFGCRILAYDPFPTPEIAAIGGTYLSLEELLAESDIISLHCPLTPQTRHLINRETIELMKDGAMIINTSRGALIDSRAALDALKAGKIGYMGLDVYEEEADLFFQDLSNQVIQDDVFARFVTLPNVLIPGHQGFFTYEALQNIAETTLSNISAFEAGRLSGNEVLAESVLR